MLSLAFATNQTNIYIFLKLYPVFSPGLAVRRAHFSGSAAVKCARSTKTFLPCFFSRSGSAFVAFQLSRKTQAKPCLGQCLFPAEDSDSYMQTVQVAAKTLKGTFWFWASPKLAAPKGTVPFGICLARTLTVSLLIMIIVTTCDIIPLPVYHVLLSMIKFVTNVI